MREGARRPDVVSGVSDCARDWYSAAAAGLLFVLGLVVEEALALMEVLELCWSMLSRLLLVGRWEEAASMEDAAVLVSLGERALMLLIMGWKEEVRSGFVQGTC